MARSTKGFSEPKNPIGTVAELFAGVGGFRLGLARSGWRTVFSNQWEPSTKVQHASDVYVANFGSEGHTNVDISRLLDLVESKEEKIPKFDLLVGGFPCQDYSVAKVLSASKGIAGKKGVLWWEIVRLIEMKKPKMVLLENVDRLLSSPAKQRGRDFAIMLASLNDLGYTVEWRIVNAADYGFPQRRRRVFIVAKKARLFRSDKAFVSEETMIQSGVLARAFPVDAGNHVNQFTIEGDLADVSQAFGAKNGKSPFRNAGCAYNRKVMTLEVAPTKGKKISLKSILVSESEVPSEYWIDKKSISRWKYLKGSKREEREHKGSGTKYFYSEGPMKFPDVLNEPSRTILTGEGGSSPSRFKHVIEGKGGRLRRLVPVELERLNGFPDDFTRFGASGNVIADSKRAFFMGNALVVGVVERIGAVLASDIQKLS